MAALSDTYYISIFNHYKKALGKKSISIALFYINALEVSIILVLGAFLKAFATQMKMTVMSSTKFWVLFVLIALFVISKNWMRYNGKKRTILNAKAKPNTMPIYLLWIIPAGCIMLALILLKV
ncbi:MULTISPECIES: hypothetical protein [Winogradskyella]|uniref:hypothetical protein n=1 Tax=Winogradskyella TaxID=286104 RepID=UPI0015CE8E3E|nr:MULTISPECIES: hypothetical protein [Winogradskyella]QXP80436.1 hypothetical protein H0I32_07400 [Winogradskyella sp. HaHa_3_26]